MSFAPKQFIRSVDFLSTENATNTSTGCVNIYGGMSVSRDSYLTNMIVVGNSTVTNLNITGNLITSSGNSLISSQWTNVDSNTDIYFGTSANSFVGIGTTTPAFNLDISGGSRITGALTVGNLNVNSGATITNMLNTTICTGTIIITGGSLNSNFNSNTLGSIITTGGNVGIGITPNNLVRLHLRAPTTSHGVYLNFDATTIAGGKSYLIGSSLSGNASNRGNLEFFDNTASVIRMIISSSGNVGIGTTNPAYTLDVTGSGDFSTFVTSGALYSTNQTTTNIVATNISGSNLRVSGTINSGDITVGNINFTGSLFQNGSSYLGSQWTTTSGNTLTYTSGNVNINSGFTSSFNSNTIGNIFTTGGNVGIRTTSPVSNSLLHINGNTVIHGDNTTQIGIYTNASDFYGSIIGKSLSYNGTIYTIRSDGANAGFSGIGMEWRNLRFYTHGPAGGTTNITASSLSSYEKMCILSNGNVGIGAATPTFKLDVSGTFRASSINVGNGSWTTNSNDVFINANNNSIYFRPSVGSSINQVQITSSGDIVINSSTESTTTSNGSLNIYGGIGIIKTMNIGGSISAIHNSHTLGNLFTTGGNVGINTKIPIGILDVRGSTGLGNNGRFYFDTGMNTGERGMWFQYDTTNNIGRIQVEQQGVSYRNLSLNPLGGNIGIATSSPQTTLHINGPGLQMGTSTDAFHFFNSTGSLYMLTGTWNSGTYIASFTSTGNVGINTTNPAYKLEVNGTSYISNQANFGNGVYLATGSVHGMLYNSTVDGPLLKGFGGGLLGTHNGTNALMWNTTGNVGIGNSTPSFNLDVSGPIRINNNQLLLDRGTGVGGMIHISMRSTTGMLTFGMGLDGATAANYSIWSYNTNGSYLSRPLYIDRFSGIVLFESGISTGNMTTTTLSSSNLIATTSTIPNIIHTNVSSTNYVGTTVSVGNLYGTLGTVSNFVASTSLSTGTLVGTTVSVGNLYGSLGTVGNFVGVNLSSSNLIATTSTIPNLVSTTSTIPNIIHTNVSSGNFVGTTVSVGNLHGSLGTIGNFVGVNLSSSNFIATTSTIPNIIHTNVSSSSYVGTTVSTGNIYGTLGTISNFVGINLSSSNLVATTSTITNLKVTGALTFVNVTSTNIVGTNISSGTLVGTTVSVGNVYGTLGTIGNFVGTNLSSSNLIATTSTIPNIIHTNVSSTNIISTGITTTNLLVTSNISASSINLSNNLNVAGTLTVINITTTNLTMSNGNALLNIVTSGTILNTGTITSGALTLRTPNNYDGRILSLTTFSNGNAYNLTFDAVNNTTNNVYWTVNQNTLSTTYSNMLTFNGGNIGIYTTSPVNTLDITGTARITTSLTTGTLFSTNQTTTNIVATSLSSGTLVGTTVSVGNLNGSTGTISNFLGTNLSSSNLIATTSTIPNIIHTNVSSSNYVGTTVSVGNLYGTLGTISNFVATTSLSTGTLVGTTVSTANHYGATGTISNFVSTALTTGGLVATGIINLSSNTVIANTVNNYTTSSGAVNITGDIVVPGSSKLCFTQTGLNPPSLNGRSNGTKILLYPNTSTTQGDFSIGVETNNTWFQVPNSAGGFKFYQGTAANFIITTTGLDVTGSGDFSSFITAANLYSTSQTTTNVVATTSLSTGTLAGTNVSVGNIFGTRATIPNIVATSNLSTGTLRTTNIFATHTSTANLRVSGNVGIGTSSPSESLEVRGNINVGNPSAAPGTGSSYIAFAGTWDDGLNTYEHTYVGERVYGGTEDSELLLFKGNDTPDRIRLLAPQHVFDTATMTGTFDTIGAAGSTTRMVIANNGVVGITNILELGYGVAGKEANAGRIGYNTFTTGLNIIGAGTVGGNRLVYIYDHLQVGTSISASNLVGTNVSTANHYGATGTISNFVGVNLSSSNLIATVSTIPNIIHTNVSSSNYFGTTVSVGNVYGSLGTVSNFVATNISSSTLISSTIASNVMSATTITGQNLSLSGNLNVAGTLTTVNITSTNLVNTNVSAGIVVASNTFSATGNSNTIGNIFTTGGNVGINNSSPSYTLDVTGSGDFSTFVTSANLYSGTLTVVNITSTNLLVTSGGLSATFNTNTIGNIFTTGGNVGIGTTSPFTNLHVYNTLDPIIGIQNGNNSLFGLQSFGDAGLRFGTYSGGTIGNSLFIAKNGNIGIGTTTPAAGLEINRGSTNNIALQLSSSGAGWGSGILFKNSSSTGKEYGIYSGISGNLHFADNISGVDRMIIASTGNVGIGTTSPSCLFSLNGTSASLNGPHIMINTSDQSLPIFQQLNWGAGNISLNFDSYYNAGWKTSNSTTVFNIYKHLSQLQFNYARGTAGSTISWTPAITIGSSGNVGIGTASPTYPLHVSGDIYSSGDVISFSDARLKTNISTIDNPLDKVSNMRGVYYTNTNTQQQETGVIAQEIREILPEVVSDRGEYLGVAYGNIVGILIEAIKELKQRIIELESK